MEGDYSTETFTAQRRDTSVPVDVGSGREGSPRPSSNDFSVPPVEHQAGGHYSLTGRHKDKKLAWQISPPMKKYGSAPSTPMNENLSNVLCLDLTWDEDEARSKKRKKADSSPPVMEEDSIKDTEERLGTKARKMIKEIDGLARDLCLMVRENPNTKREIKQATGKLRSVASQLMTGEIQQILQSLGQRRKTTTLKGTDEQEATAFDTGCRRIKELEAEVKALKKQNNNLSREVNNLKRENGTYKPEMEEKLFMQGFESYKEVENREWPDRIYKASFMATGSPLRASKDTDLVVLEESGLGNEFISKQYAERYPELKEVIGKVGAITVTTKMIGLGAQQTANDKWVIKAVVNDSGRDWFETLSDIKKLAIEGGRRKLAVYPPEGDPGGTATRKMAEYVFRESGIKCLVYIKQLEEANRQPKKKSTDVLFLRQEGKTYADLLKIVKDKVKPNSEGGKAIRMIKEGRDGRMVVVLKENSEKAIEEINKEVGREMSIMKGKNRENSVINIYNIDSVATSAEVRDAICQNINEDPSRIRVGDPRQTTRGNNAVTVSLTKEGAKQLLKKKEIKVGLNWCSIKERVNVTRCYRCFKYGHISRECAEAEDASERCRRCGSVGHLKKDCKGAERCLTCKMDGHETGSGKCPEFRKALLTERNKRERDRPNR